MRKSLEFVEAFSKAGIDFIAVPVMNAEHRVELVKMVEDILTKEIEMAEKDDKD